jgi:hypothetical protein
MELRNMLDLFVSKAFGLWQREPVVITAAITAALDAGVVFGLPLTMEQKTALIGMVTSLGVLIARSQVSPVS